MSLTQTLETATLTGYRLSPQQQRLWWLQRDSPAFHTSIAIHIRGPLDEGRLREAVAEVLERHEILRTTFRAVGEGEASGAEGALQVVHDDLPPRWSKIDLRPVAPEHLGKELGNLLRIEGLQPFALETGPVLRLTVVLLPEAEHVLMIHQPALCGDVASLYNIFHEIARCYSPHEEPEAYTRPMPYAQFSEWQLQLLELDDGAEAEFWRRWDYSELLEFPLPCAQPHRNVTTPAFQPMSTRRELEPGMEREIQELATAVAASEQTLLVAAWAALLHRLTTRRWLGLARNACGRTYDDLKDSLGLFEKYLPITTEATSGMTFMQLVQQVRGHSEVAEDWQEYFDWGAVRHELGDQLLGRLPVGFERLERPAPVAALGMSFTVLAEHGCNERFQLKLTMLNDCEQGVAKLQYDAAVCDPGDACRMLHRYVRLLAAVLADPQMPLSEIPLLSPGERHHLLHEVNDTDRRWPSSASNSVPAAIAEQCARRPEAVAVEAGAARLSYGELADQSEAWARVLVRLGKGPEPIVGVCLERSPRLIVALLAVMKAGGAFVPLDPEYPQERLGFMLEDSRAALVLAEARTAATLPPGPYRVLTMEAGAPEEAGPDLPDARDLESSRAAYAIYTSGSTGRPKAAVNSHGALLNRLLWMQREIPLGPEDRVLHKTPYSFDVALWELFWPLMVGARMVVTRPGGHRDAAYLVKLIATAGVTTAHFVPTMLRVFLEEPGVAEGCRSLRRVVASGEILPPTLAERARGLLPAKLYNLYGPTEAAIDVTSWPVADTGGAALPIGAPIDNLRCFVRNERGGLCPVGAAGELLLAGDGLARGYLGRPALTAERFIPDPFGGRPGERLYRTGDRARRRSDGTLDFLGRLDLQVKIRGFRVEPAEIEEALVAHPLVTEAVVLPRGRKGGGGRLIAYVAQGGVIEGAPRLSSGELRRFLTSRLPEFLIPSAFILLRRLPLLPNGKVDRRGLTSLQGERERKPVPPRNSVEALLVEIWSQVLPVDEVGIYDDFLELGGDSILSLQIVAKANQAGLGLVPGELLQQRTIANLARAAGSQGRIQAEQGSLSGEVQLTPVQTWFLKNNLRHPEHWNQSLLLEFRQPVDLAALGKALQILESHHDGLRSRFERRIGSWTQRIVPATEAKPLSVLDLRRLGEPEAEVEETRVLAATQGSLNLHEGPVWRSVLLEDGRRQRLLIVIHHLVVDAISWRILLEDLEELYRRSQRGAKEALRLPAKTTSVRQWGQRLMEYARRQDVAQQLDYWLALPWDEICALPLDDLSPEGLEPEERKRTIRRSNTTASTHEVRCALTADETHALLTEVPKAYRTEINDVLITALARTVSRWTGSSTLLLDMEGHGREKLFHDVDLSRTLGWFTSLYPVVIDFGQGAEPGEALRSVKEQLRRLPERGIGYGLLRYLDAQGDAATALARLPRSEILFNYLGQLEGSGTGGSLFTVIPGVSGPERHPEDPRSHLLEINAGIWSDTLEVTWSFSDRLHRRETIEVLAQRFREALSGLIEHCRSFRDGSRGFTVSDFCRSGLSPKELESLVSELGGGAVVKDIYPLSGSQEGMLMYLLVGDGADRQVFFNQLHCRLMGELQPPAFQRAWQQVVDRHPSLRTQFRWRDQPRPLQAVLDRVEPEWTLEDWREVPARHHEGRLATYLETDRRRPFDLQRAPLVRLALLRTSAAEHRFVLSYHHLILDGWSISLLLNEVLTRYQAIVGGGRATLPPVPGYGDYVEWLKAQDSVAAEHFWRDWLADLKAPTRLRVERRAGQEPPGAGYGMESVRLSPSGTASLVSAARGGRLTLNTLVQGAWALLLQRYSGQREVLFGSVVSGRQGGFESTIGLFINALPVRAKFSESSELSAGTWLQALQEDGIETRRFEHCPLEQIQRWSSLDRDMPLFETLLVFENYPVDQELKEGARQLQVRDVEVDERTNYPLALFIFPGEELEFILHYDGRRFDAATAALLLADHRRLLERLAANLDAPLAEVTRPTAADLRQVMEQAGAGPPTNDPVPPVVESFLRQAAATPEAPAVIPVEAGAPAWSYRELRRHSAAVAAAVARVTKDFEAPGAVVAVHLERSGYLIAALLGVLEAGATYVPLDPSWPTGRVETILRDCGARLILADHTLPGEAGGCRRLDPATLPQPGDDSTLVADAVAVPEDRLAYLLYTSGSSGEPKGVGISRRGLALHTAAARANFSLEPGDRLLQFASPAFDTSAEEIFPTLTTGAALVLRNDAMLASPRAFFGSCAEAGVTALDLPTSFWHRLMAEAEDAETLPPDLRLLILGGERAEPEFTAAWRRRAPEVALLNTYGPTEATVVATAATLHRRSPEELAEAAEVPIGTPLPHVCTYVLDHTGAPVALGVPGELAIGGGSLARGYHGNPRRTAERFVPDPFPQSGKPGGRLFLSGDLVRWMPDGELRFLGRLDTQIKLRGQRIEPGEIEALLTAQPGVAEAAVTLVEAAVGDKGGGRLAAYVVPDTDDPEAPEGPPSLEALRRRLRRNLPEVMVPAVFVPMAELPRTAGGKLDRRALPAVDTEPAERAGRFVEPRNEAEEAVAGLFEELLGVDRVGAFDHFFELGGHSLLATQLVSRVREDFEVDLPLRIVFQSPTVAKLAAEIARLILEDLEGLSDEEVEEFL